MSNSEPFGDWFDAMRAANVGDPRNGRPSWTDLARQAKVSVSTITEAVNGTRKASPKTVQKIATALHVTPEQVSDWLGAPRVSRPYSPPAEAALLSRHERDSIDNLIRAIARGREEVTGNAQHPAPMTTPTEGEQVATTEAFTPVGDPVPPAESADDGPASQAGRSRPTRRRQRQDG